ncbi:hypothetical protein Tco_1182837 [Tanacetum coccineum]
MGHVRSTGALEFLGRIPFLKAIGYDVELMNITGFKLKNLRQLWQTLFKIINRYTTSKHTCLDGAKVNTLQILWVVMNKHHVDYVMLILEDTIYLIMHPEKQDVFLPYPRYTKLIINYLLSTYQNVPRRVDASQQTPPEDDHVSQIKIDGRSTKVKDADVDNFKRCCTSYTFDVGYRVLRGLLLHRSSINNSASLSNKFRGFYFSFKFGISGLLHHVVTTIADRIRGFATMSSEVKGDCFTTTCDAVTMTDIKKRLEDSKSLKVKIKQMKRLDAKTPIQTSEEINQANLQEALELSKAMDMRKIEAEKKAQAKLEAKSTMD